MKVAIVPNIARREAVDCAWEVQKILGQHGWEVLVKEDLFDQTGAFCGEPEDSLAACDLLIAVGGDGTIIHTAKLAARCDRPILGINAGRLGYTASLERKDIERLPALLEEEHREERRLMLETQLISQHGEKRFWALNDGVVSGETAAIVQYEMALGENRGYQYRADGFIVATPTGSTGYSLSAGGPVIQPELDCLVYTPVCPHSLFGRSVVFGGDTRLVVTIPENNSRVFFTVDGEPPTEIFAGDRLVFSKARRYARFLRLGKRDFYDILNQKITSA